MWQHRLEHDRTRGRDAVQLWALPCRLLQVGESQFGIPRRSAACRPGEPGGRASTAALRRQGGPLDMDWMGLAWSLWAELKMVRGIACAGLYRVADGHHRLQMCIRDSCWAS